MATEGPITVAIDAMGGDQAPGAVVRAVAEASLTRTGGRPVYFVLVGDEIALTEQLVRLDHDSERIQLVHAPTEIGLSERPRQAIEDRPEASILKATKLVADGEADALVSAGNPGVAVLSTTRRLELIEGVDRAALASVYPTPRHHGETDDPFSLILDVGASLRAEADQLVTFALMGSAYARIVTRNDDPRVALLSSSRERTVGPAEVVEAHEQLGAREDVDFYGNIEGHEIPRGLTDVVVCEGFVGDVALKILEGVSEAAVDLARSAYDSKLVWKAGLKLLGDGLRQLKQRTDFEEYGGAPLLGVDRVVILCHPRSGQKAFGNALKLAIKNVQADLPAVIGRSLEGDR